MFTTKEYVLSKVSQEAIFEYYFGEKIELFKRYKNPLRSDPSPGCSFYYGQSGDLLFYDVREGGLDCFGFIIRKFNLKSVYDAVIKVRVDFKLIKNHIPEVSPLQEKEPFLKEIKIIRKKFTPEELDFWQIPDIIVDQNTLEEQGIYSISDLWFNDSYYGSNLKFTFAYKQFKPYQYQIYRPLADKSQKFRCTDGRFVYGWKNLRDDVDYVILNKSRKDNFYAQLLGYNSLGIIAEGYNLSEKMIYLLKSKYKKIYICFDNDEVGIQKTNKIITKYPFITPKYSLSGKDFTDMCKQEGANWTKQNFIC